MTNLEEDVGTSKFLDWAQTAGKLWISDKIRLGRHRSDEQQGRCIMAVESIPKGEKLFEIPRESVLNVTTTKLCEQNDEMGEILVLKLGHWEGLIIAILYELKVVKDESHWWAYFQVWPQPSAINSLMYWSEDEISHLTPSTVSSRIGREGAEAMYMRVMAHIKELGLSQLETVTWDEFVHVASIIMSYSFDMERADYESDDEELDEDMTDSASGEAVTHSTVWSDGFLKSMVPMADMLNADTHKCNANLTYSPESLIMVAVKDIAAGEQVYNIYGEFSNSEILRRYGYVEWAGSKHDCGEISLETIVAATQICMGSSRAVIDKVLDFIMNQADIRDEVLEGETLIMDSYDCYVDGQFSPELVSVLQILSCILQVPGVEQLNDKVLLSYLQNLVKRSIQNVNANEITRSCAHLCECAVDLRLRAYPSFSFREPSPNAEPQSVKELKIKMAECVLRSEVKSFQNCLLLLENEYQLVDDNSLLDKIIVPKRKIGHKKNKTTPAKRMKK
ncbi:LANO_0B04346g1_1 [Lachancea nothofagi CBS 11611]|uniref:LANO_0B04346g1_1 n=1 Tax=Lachancea nothofagi CBS 11611 TaxID=1266666 RepID=A0A1G4IXW3_9SACH|nr:LANO_0B04346g1_1 [Lachancea nothofagi CBS 11611]